MASTTSNMGLTKWDAPNDAFSHAQLAANFQAIDDHDHTPGRGKQIPAGGIAPLAIGTTELKDGTFTSDKIANGAVTTGKIADGSVTAAKIAAGAGIADSQLASPNNAVYRTVHHWAGRGTLLASGSKYIIGAGNFTVAGSDTTTAIDPFYFDDADLASALTPKFRLRVQVYTNATAPTSTFTVGLYSITAVAGGANAHNWSINASAETGSTLPFAAPALSTRNQSATSNFAVPADGHYVPVVAVSVASMVANSAVEIAVQLQSVHV